MVCSSVNFTYGLEHLLCFCSAMRFSTGDASFKEAYCIFDWTGRPVVNLEVEVFNWSLALVNKERFYRGADKSLARPTSRFILFNNNNN